MLPVSKDPRKIGTSQLRSKERRAADPAVKDRAAVHAAGQEAAAREEILPSPEKLGSNTSLESLSGPDFFQRPLKIIISCGGVRSPNPLRSVGWGTWLTTTMTWRRSTKLWKSWERQTGAAFVNTSAQLRLNKRRGIVKVDLVFLAAYGIILNKFIWMAFIKLWPIRCRLTEKVTKSSTLKSEPTSAEACTYLHDRKYSVVWAFVTKLITCHYNYIGRSNPDVMWSMATQ